MTTSIPLNQRSAQITQGSARVAHRALLFSLGLNRDDFQKPFVAVVNSWNEIVPGCVHLDKLAKAVKEDIREASGVPFEFNTIGVCDGLAQGHVGMKYSLPSREIIAASCEIMIQAHQLDGAVFLASCDKITPAMLMAAARVDVPSIVVMPGAMAPGEYEGRKICLSDTREFAGRFEKGELPLEELYHIEEIACPTPGACPMMGTASTMACIGEALGMTLPFSATLAATSSAKMREAYLAGKRVVELIREGLKPSHIITQASLENALRLTMALGASTNTILHLPAIAYERGLSITLQDIDRASRTTPYLVSLNPSGTQTMEDLHAAGGVPAVLKAMGPMVHRETLNVSGATTGQVVDSVAQWEQSVIHPWDNPLYPDGGLAILRGNLAPQGAVVKKSAVRQKMWVHQGPARVFNSMEEATQAVVARKVVPGSVVVIRYEGPVGGPGMREMQMITAIMVGMGLADDTPLVTDGRFSGSTRGPCVGYVCPEAAVGGPIAVVQDGDVIAIDLNERRLEVHLAEAQIRERLGRWVPPRNPDRGILGIYASLSASADKGAVWAPK